MTDCSDWLCEHEKWYNDEREREVQHMNKSEVVKDLDFWKSVNAETSEYESVVSLGSWNEADKLDETDD